MKVMHSFGIKVVACAGIAMALTVGLSWSFVESTAAVRAVGTDSQGRTLSAHGGAPLAPFGAGIIRRSATLVS
jgi:hypothetical protein